MNALENSGGGPDRALLAQARERIRRRRNFRTHVVAQAIGSLFLVLVWAMTEYNNAGGWPTALRTGRHNHDWDPWVIYPLIGALLALGMHAWVAFRRHDPTELEIEREVNRMTSERS
jgi:hypothetical protein